MSAAGRRSARRSPPDTRPGALLLGGLRRGALLVFLPVLRRGPGARVAHLRRERLVPPVVVVQDRARRDARERARAVHVDARRADGVASVGDPAGRDRRADDRRARARVPRRARAGARARAATGGRPRSPGRRSGSGSRSRCSWRRSRSRSASRSSASSGSQPVLWLAFALPLAVGPDLPGPSVDSPAPVSSSRRSSVWAARCAAAARGGAAAFWWGLAAGVRRVPGAGGGRRRGRPAPTRGSSAGPAAAGPRR